MKVYIEEFNKHLDYFKKLNECDVDDLEIYENGELLEVSKVLTEEFSFTGLSNKDFISYGIYKIKSMNELGGDY